MKRAKDLTALFSPKTVAVVGASEKFGAGSLVIENLKALGFPGDIFPVNPRYPELMGFKCYPSLSDIPPDVPIDCVAVVLGAGRILPVLQEAAHRDVRAAWAFASGFAEAGAAGKALQAELKSFCDTNGIAFCGPNCVGVVNLHRPSATFSAPLSPTLRRGNIGAVVQSGSVALALANSNRGIGFSVLVSSGNEAVLDAVDYIEHLLQDDHTRVIIAFLEGIRRPEAFRRACIRAAELRKPIIAVKVGRSEMARNTVVSHTGALAGADAIHDAFFEKYGVIRVDDLDQLLETAALFSFLVDRMPRGNRVGMVTVSGGEIGLVGDIAQSLSLSFPDLSANTVAALRNTLPAYTPIANPLDAWGSGDLERTYPGCLEILAREAAIDIIAVSQDAPPGMAEKQVVQYTDVAKAAVHCAAGEKPVVVFSHVSGGLDPRLKGILDDGGVPFLQGTRESLSAIDHLTAYARFQAERPDKPAWQAPAAPDPQAFVSQLSRHSGVISYSQSRSILSAYGINGPREFMVQSAAEAAEAARALRYPVAVKGQSATVPHKTEAGLVYLDVEDETGLRTAFAALRESMRACDPAAAWEGVLIQEMLASEAVEVIVGISNDPAFGPAVLLGLGGVWVELLKDTLLKLPPVRHAEAVEMIRRLKGYRILEGFRGKPRADINALADTIVQTAVLAIDLEPVLQSLDLNPLMVLPEGKGVAAVDVLMECGPAAMRSG